jgi:hypothetical protein
MYFIVVKKKIYLVSYKLLYLLTNYYQLKIYR